MPDAPARAEEVHARQWSNAGGAPRAGRRLRYAPIAGRQKWEATVMRRSGRNA